MVIMIASLNLIVPQWLDWAPIPFTPMATGNIGNQITASHYLLPCTVVVNKNFSTHVQTLYYTNIHNVYARATCNMKSP